MPFVLNTLDMLAGDERFLEIRTRKPVHGTLSKVNQLTMTAKEETDKGRRVVHQLLRRPAVAKGQAFDEQIDSLKKGRKGNSQEATIEFLQSQEAGQRKSTIETEKIETRRRHRDQEGRSRAGSASCAACKTAASCGRCCCRPFRR